MQERVKEFILLLRKFNNAKKEEHAHFFKWKAEVFFGEDEEI